MGLGDGEAPPKGQGAWRTWEGSLQRGTSLTAHLQNWPPSGGLAGSGPSLLTSKLKGTGTQL